MYATNYYGNGGTLDGIDQTKLVDSSSNTRAQATATGVTITGTLSATTTADATPAIIATNTGGISGIIQRWVGDPSPSTPENGSLQIVQSGTRDYLENALTPAQISFQTQWLGDGSVDYPYLINSEAGLRKMHDNLTGH